MEFPFPYPYTERPVEELVTFVNGTAAKYAETLLSGTTVPMIIVKVRRLYHKVPYQCGYLGAGNGAEDDA